MPPLLLLLLPPPLWCKGCASVAALADAAAAKVASDAVLAAKNAELAKFKDDTTTAVAQAKAASDKALADAKVASDAALAAKDAQIAKLTADNAAALSSLKKSFNALATKWNKKNPKAKVTLVK